MKSTLFKFFLVLCIAAFGNLSSVKACINPDTIATLAFNLNEMGTEAEIRIGNLKLGTETPNTFCSCGLDSYSEVFNFVSYIAFVYQGTNDVYPNFAPFQATQPASDAWDVSLPNFPGWEGYVGEVINAGLMTDEAVELIIRLQPPSGTIATLADADSILTLSYLGTDMWDEVNQSIAEDHQGLRNLGNDISDKNITIQPDSYFEDLDAALIVSTSAPNSLIRTLAVTPNPSTDQTLLSYSLVEQTSIEIVIYDLLGRRVYSSQELPNGVGKHEVMLSLDQILQKPGTYILGLQNDTNQEFIKILKL